MSRQAKPGDVTSSAGTTIVGGQPPGRKHVRVHVPVGLERVLYLAASDGAFRDELLRDRDRAVCSRGFQLRGSELAMLRLAPVAQLEAAIDGLDTSTENVGRRSFMKAVAAGAVALSAASGCGDEGGGADVGVDVPVSYPDAGITDYQLGPDTPMAGIDTWSPTDTVPVDVPVAVGDAGILPDTGAPDGNK